MSGRVAGLLARKAERLPEICKVASLLGFRFDEEVIVGICSSTAFAASPTGPCAIENDSVTRTTSTMTLDALVLLIEAEGAHAWLVLLRSNAY